MATASLELSEDAIKNLNAMAEEQHTSIEGIIESFAVQPIFTAEQLQEIDIAINEDDAGDHASREEVAAAFGSFRS